MDEETVWLVTNIDEEKMLFTLQAADGSEEGIKVPMKDALNKIKDIDRYVHDKLMMHLIQLINLTQQWVKRQKA